MKTEELEEEFRDFRKEYNTKTMQIIQGYFIGYQGTSIENSKLIDALNKHARSDEVVKSKVEGDVFLGKLVPRDFYYKRHPISPCSEAPPSVWKYLVVGSYNSDQALDILSKFLIRGIEFQTILYAQYQKCKSKIFDELKDRLDFSAVIYDRAERSLIAGNTTQKYAYSTLYYGYTPKNELVYSNNKEIINEFCREIYRMPKNSYMQDGILYTSRGKKYIFTPEKVKTTEETIKDLEFKVGVLESKLKRFEALEEKYNTLLSYYLEEKKEDSSTEAKVKKYNYKATPTENN